MFISVAKINIKKKEDMFFLVVSGPGLEVIKLEFILKLKIKHNDWLLADTCLQAANQCSIF